MARRDVTITRISPTSAFRVGLALSLVGLIAWMLAVCLLYIGLNQVCLLYTSPSPRDRG